MMSISRLNWSWSCGRYSWSNPRRSDGFTFSTLHRLDRDALLPVVLLHVGFDDRLELLGDALALERHGFLAVDVHRRHWDFARAGQADADVGVLRFARTIYHAPHHRHAHVLDAGIAALPDRHLLPQVGLNLVRQFLKHGTGGAPATRAGADHRRERAQSHGLQDLLRNDHLARAVAARLRRER